MKVEELARVRPGEYTRKQLLEELQASYGRTGKNGWSLTEVIRLHRRDRLKILDLLHGIARTSTGAMRAQPYPGRFKLRTVDGQPLEIVKVRPNPDATPEVVVDPESGIAHHHPHQWEPQVYTFGPEAECAIADDHDMLNSAEWLLNEYGWEARKGGSNKRRWRVKGPRGQGSGDKWRIVEDAFAVRFPQKCRIGKERAD